MPRIPQRHKSQLLTVAIRLHVLRGIDRVWIWSGHAMIHIRVQQPQHDHPHQWTSRQNVLRVAADELGLPENLVEVHGSQDPADWAVWTLETMDDPGVVVYP